MKPSILESIRMLDDQTVEIVFKDHVHVSVEDMGEMYAYFNRFTGERPTKRLVVAGKKTNMSREARKYGEQESVRRKDLCIAEAMVVNTFIQKMMANFYLKYVKDDYPSRAFTDIEEAKAWLLDFGKD